MFWPIYKSKIVLSKEQRDIYINFVLASYPSLKDYKSQNFKIPPHTFGDFLYENFEKEVASFCTPTYRQNNVKDCWAYVTSFGKPISYWHHHLRSSTINGVYYLKVNEKDKGIQFRYKDNILHLQPAVNDLLIFPSWLEHYPFPSEDENIRISINMEMLCEQSANELFAMK